MSSVATRSGQAITNALTLISSTFSGNSAPIGGGVYNIEGVLQIGNTILNAGSSGANIANPYATVSSWGYNLSSDDGGGSLTNATDQINVSPMLGPLQDNGGPTFTHALSDGSPAINTGKNFSGDASDQHRRAFAHPR